MIYPSLQLVTARRPNCEKNQQQQLHFFGLALYDIFTLGSSFNKKRATFRGLRESTKGVHRKDRSIDFRPKSHNHGASTIRTATLQLLIIRRLYMCGWTCLNSEISSVGDDLQRYPTISKRFQLETFRVNRVSLGAYSMWPQKGYFQTVHFLGGGVKDWKIDRTHL